MYQKTIYLFKAVHYTWDEEFDVGDTVVKEKYYQKYGNELDTYVFLFKFQKACVNVEYIRVVKFPMVPDDHRVSSNDSVYMLPPEVEDSILEYLH